MPLVSVVVPVYNVEEYIHRCVESLINQTLNDLEIILVDDGSPDNCPVICDCLAKKDNRIIVVHKENGGLSSARNAGMKVATGKYIGFVDSDDDVEPDMYEKMVTVAEQYNVDFVMSDYRRIPRNGKSYIKTLDIEGGLYDREKIIKDIFPNLIMRECIDYGPLLSVWHCIYRRDFLRHNQLTFDEDVKWSEDNIFSSILGYCCNSFYYLKGEALYHYYENPGTITRSYRKGSWQVYCKMNHHLHDYFDVVEDYDFSRQLKLHMIYYICSCVNQESQLPKSKAIKMISEILNSNDAVEAFRDFKMPKIPLKFRFMLYLMKYRCNRLLYFLKNRI